MKIGRKKKYGGWSEEDIDKMERLVKKIRVAHGEDPGNGRVGTTRALRDRYWNFENAYFKWTNKSTSAQKSNGRKWGKQLIKARQDDEIASIGSNKRKLLNKKQRKRWSRLRISVKCCYCIIVARPTD
jgi:hypothetical protein